MLKSYKWWMALAYGSVALGWATRGNYPSALLWIVLAGAWLIMSASSSKKPYG